MSAQIAIVSKEARGVCYLLAGTLLAATGASAQESPAWLQRINGTFNSQLFNAGSMSSGETTLNFAGSVPFGGTYRFADKGAQTAGTLADCKAAGQRVINCTWSDKYGSGPLQLKFAEDYASFEGYWNSGAALPQYRWSGTRR